MEERKAMVSGTDRADTNENYVIRTENFKGNRIFFHL
jgi:protein subunit release factor A